MSGGIHIQLKESTGTPANGAGQTGFAPGQGPDQHLEQKLEKTYKNSAPYRGEKQNPLFAVFTGFLWMPLAVLVLEVFFNLAGIGQGEMVKPDLKLGSRHIPGKLVTWHLEGYSRNRINSVGMRDVEHDLAKPAAIKRIAFLGDSYTEGLQLDMKDTFARRMESSLTAGQVPMFESLNFGCSGYSTGQEMLQFEQEVAPYRPDLVVVLYTPGDTRENSLAPDKRAEADPRPYFYLDQNKDLQEDDGILALNYEKLRPRPLREFLRAHSTIFGAYTQTNLSLKMSDKLFFRVSRLLSRLGDRAAASLCCSGPGQAKAARAGLIPPVPGEPDQLAVSVALIKRLDKDVKATGGKLIVMAYPDISKGDPLYVSLRARLAKLAKSQGFGYLDLSDSFSHNISPNDLFIKVHFSKLGHDLTARELTAYLKKAGYVPN